MTDGGFFTTYGDITLSGPVDGPDRDTAPDDGWVVRAHNANHGLPDVFGVYAICLK